jgi:hypothetical protein
MQSYLQYRSIGKQVTAHLNSKGFRPNAGRATGDSASGTISQLNVIDPIDRVDPIDSNEVEAQTERNPVVLGYLPANIDDELEIIPTSQPLEPAGTHLGIALTGVDVRSRTTIEDRSLGKVFIVGFDNERDSANPHNWSIIRRVVLTVNIGLITSVVGLASAIDSAALPQAAAAFGVSIVAESLATGLVGISSLFGVCFNIHLGMLTSALVSRWYWIWSFYSGSNFGNRRTNSCIYWITCSLHAFPYGSGFVEKPWRTSSLPIFLRFLWRLSIFGGWGIII